MTKPFLGVAFGGGGVRGAAHIGVLQELHKAGLEIGIVSGVSAGSVIAAMYAATMDPFWIEEKFKIIWESDAFQVSSKKFFNKQDPESFLARFRNSFIDHTILMMSLHATSIIDKKPLEETIRTLVPVNSFEELKIPLIVVATDLETGEDILYDNGQLIDALLQSSAIPGILRPKISGKKVIVDGGVGMPIPIPVIKDKCEFCLAVDIGLYNLKKLNNLNAISIKKRSEIITSNRLKTLLASEADFVIRPDTLGMQWSDFDQGVALFEQGKIAAKNSLDKLQKKINKKKNELIDLKNG